MTNVSIGLIILIVVAAILVLYLVPVMVWLNALFARAHVGIFTLVAMRLRRVPPSLIVYSRISAIKASRLLALPSPSMSPQRPRAGQ